MVCENKSLNLQAGNARLNKEVDLLNIQVDNMEQRNRNINLLVHGIPEEVGENTTEKCCKLINEKVVDLECADIARSHRYGPVPFKKTRPRKQGQENTAKKTRPRKHGQENTAKKTRPRKQGQENKAKKTRPRKQGQLSFVLAQKLKN